MRLRSISILSLLSLWLCVSQAVPLRGQEAAPGAAIPPAEISLPKLTQAAAPPQAQPGPTISSSVSSNKQFVVHGADLTVRSAFCLMSEETAGTLGRLLKDEGRYAIPVVVEVKTPPNINPAEPPVRYRITLMDFGGFHLQLSVQLRNDFRTEDYTRELVRILLAERILRNHKDINTQREKPILPEWLLTGVMQAMDFRSRSRPSALFAAVFKSGQVYSIDRILAADPKNLDALSRGVYEVSSCALLLTLLDQPDGPLRVSRFLGALATDDRPDRELLQQHFPTLGASKNSLEKWWTLQMASLSTPSAFETMTIKETEEMLDKALTLHFTDRIGEEPADIKAGREGKGIFGWLKRDDKAKEKDKDKEQPKPEEATAAVSSNTLSMPISTTPSSALPVEGNAANFPPPLGTPAPGSDLPPLPSSLAPSSSPSSGAPPLPQDTLETPPASTTAPSAADGDASPLPAKEKEAAEPAKPDGGAQTQKASSSSTPEPAPAKPKPRSRRSTPKPASEPKPAAATAPDQAKPAAAPAPAVAPQQTGDKATDKPAEPTAPEAGAPEEKKERSRFRFPKIFGGKNVTYTIMLLAMAAVAENAKEKEKEKPTVNEQQTAAPAEPPASLPKNNRSVGSRPEEPATALPKNNRRVGSKPAGLPEPSVPAAPTPPPPASAPAAPAEAAAPAGPEAPKEEEAPLMERKPSRFNPLRWFKREDKEKTAEETPAPSPVPAPPSPGGANEAEKPSTGSAAPKSSQNNNSNSASRTSTPPPEKPADLPAQPARTASRSSTSNSKIKSELAALEDYRRIWKRSDREAIFNRNLAMLNALKTRAHPLYKPLVEDYATVVQQLVDGKERGIAEKLETLRQRRMQIQGKAKAVESLLDWYEASETPNYSNLFDDYLKLRDRLERERAQRPDVISRALDSLEKEYE